MLLKRFTDEKPQHGSVGSDGERRMSLIRRQSRNKTTGRYSYDGQLERLCVCGHRLGIHTAEPPHIIDDLVDGVRVWCPGFKPRKVK